MKALRDAGTLVLIVAAALAIRVAPVEQADPPASERPAALVAVAPPVMAAPAPVAVEERLLRVDVEDLEHAVLPTDAQLQAALSLESLEVGLTDGDLEAVTEQVADLVHAMVIGAAQGPTGELMSRAAAALEAAAPKPPCARAG